MIVHGREPGPYTSPGRITVHGTSPAACACKHHLLARDLGVHVGHAVRPHRVVLGHAVGEVEREGGDRGQVQEARRRVASGVQRVAGAEHVHAPDRIRVVAHRDDRRRVDHQIAAGGVALPVARLRHVAGHDAALGVGPHVHAPDLGAPRRVVVGQRPADEAERAGHEDPCRISHWPPVPPGPACGASGRWCRPGPGVTSTSSIRARIITSPRPRPSARLGRQWPLSLHGQLDLVRGRRAGHLERPLGRVGPVLDRIGRRLAGGDQDLRHVALGRVDVTEPAAQQRAHGGQPLRPPRSAAG